MDERYKADNKFEDIFKDSCYELHKSYNPLVFEAFIDTRVIRNLKLIKELSEAKNVGGLRNISSLLKVLDTLSDLKFVKDIYMLLSKVAHYEANKLDALITIISVSPKYAVNIALETVRENSKWVVENNDKVRIGIENNMIENLLKDEK